LTNIDLRYIDPAPSQNNGSQITRRGKWQK
jgi:hypothetical protein